MQFSITEPVLSPEAIHFFLRFIRDAILPSANIFMDFALAFFPILFALELAKEALNIAQGRDNNLAKLFIKFFTITILLAAFSPNGGTSTFGGGSFALGLRDGFLRIPFSAVDTFYKVSDAKVDEVKAYRKMLTKDQSGIIKTAFSLATLFAKINPINILAAIAYFISNLVGLAVFMSAYVAYSLVLIVGPLAVMCLISDELGFIFTAWVKSILAYVVIFIVICLALDANMQFQVSAIKMAHGETGLGFWKSTKVTLYMAVLSFGNFLAAMKIGPILFKIGDGQTLLGK